MAKDKTDETIDKITGNGNKLFSVTASQFQGRTEGDVIQFYLEAESIEKAYEFGRPKAHKIIGANSIVKIGEVKD